MVLTTGNKSELATGYATLYGDMCGGFNVLKDTYKMQVYALCEWRNKNRGKDFLGPRGEVIPPRVTAKAPTAELRPNQKDEDSLPPYEVLDGILDCLIEKECALKEIVAEGYDRKTVERVAALVYKAEYKRRQSAPGVKVTGKSFGRDRRYPITNGFKEGKL
jgi:NAD+ synthase